MGGKRKGGRSVAVAAPSVPAARAGWPRRTFLLVALVLLLTADDRYVGQVADGRQMIWTAVAIAETGGIGQARGRDFTIPRPEGDGVSRFGLGMTLAQLPAALLAPVVEARLGPGTSQPLFLLVPLLGVLGAALGAARAAAWLGAGPAGQGLALLLASLGSPLASYAAMEFSEPLQAALLAWAYAWALGSARAADARRPARLALAAGAAAGAAVLVKSSMAVVAPLVLLPLLGAGTWRRDAIRRIAWAAAGAVVPLVAWVAFELSRFGRPFGGYAGEGFTHPLGDGLWRLLIGPNRGLLLFFPAALVAALALARHPRTGSGAGRLLDPLGAVLPCLVLLLLAAGYWGWHGNEGWGPRLLVPGLPLLAAWVGVAAASWPRARRLGLGTVSVLLNLLPLVQHPTPIATYVNNCVWPLVDERESHGVPGYGRIDEPDGRVRVGPDLVLADVPSASPFRVHAWFLRAGAASDAVAAARILDRPPWQSARPDIVPRLGPLSPELARYFARPWSLRWWGRGFARGPESAADPAVYDEGLLDQVVRAQQLGDGELALGLARKLHRLAPGGESIARVLESLRLLGRVEEARRFLAGEPAERRRDLKINVVLALFQRDAGDEPGARTLLESARPSFPDAPFVALIDAPLSAWPRGLDAMTERPRADLPAAR